MLNSDAKEVEKCTIVWQGAEEENTMLLGLGVTDFTGHLPFCFSGDEVTQLTNGGVSVEPRHLLFGILVGLEELENRKSTKFWVQDTKKDKLVEILLALQTYFKKDSLEMMIMDVAYIIGEQNGYVMKSTVLKAGLTILPKSSSLRVELIMSSWIQVSQMNDEKILENIVKLLKETDLDYVGKKSSKTKELVCFYGLCALVFLKKSKEEIDDYIQEYIEPNITMNVFFEKINLLLQNPNNYTPKDMRVA